MPLTPEFLKRTGYLRMIWRSLSLVSRNGLTLLPVVIVFCLPIDLLYDIATSKVRKLVWVGASLMIYSLVNYHLHTVY